MGGIPGAPVQIGRPLGSVDGSDRLPHSLMVLLENQRRNEDAGLLLRRTLMLRRDGI
jgi:hypothetical protein